MDEDSVFDMESDAPREGEALAVASEADEVVRFMVVFHA